MLLNGPRGNSLEKNARHFSHARGLGIECGSVEPGWACGPCGCASAAMVAWRGASLLVTLSSPRESVLDPRLKEALAATWDSLFP